MGMALGRLAQEILPLRFTSDPDSGQTHHQRHGRVASEIIVDRNECASTSRSQRPASASAYRETIRKKD